jgi:FAD/FMN-containing dehydrogenase
MIIHVSPGLSRRHFLVGTSALGLAAGLAPGHMIETAHALADPPDWEDLAKRLIGPLLGPRDSRFVRFAEPFNLAYDTDERQPTVIALCANSQDVATAVNWARDHEIKPVVRSGGHSYAGYSMGRGLMIDVTLMRRFSWSRAHTQLTVECGAPNGDVYNVLRSENRTLTHGRCPTVGIAGFLLGGGIGFNMRLHGVASDHLVATDIVTADGRLRTVSAHDHERLFWACRGGGGGNFGINTSFTLETVPADPRVTVFSIKWLAVRDKAEKIAFALMAALDRGDNRLGSRFQFYQDRSGSNGGDAVVAVLGELHGGEDEVRRLLETVLSGDFRPTTAIIKELGYWDAQDFLLDWDGPLRFHERSIFLTRNLDAAAIHQAFDGLWDWPASADKSLHPDVRFFQTGGRMNAMKPGDTAFVHRNSRWLLVSGLPWSAEDGQEWVDGNRRRQDELFAAMWKYGNEESYQNFADPALENWEDAYYRSNIGGLRNVKHTYDPGELFTFPQAIRPA